MSFYTQLLANLFPSWSKVRADPSSEGYRILNGLTEPLENAFKESVKVSLLNGTLDCNFSTQELAHLYTIDYSEATVDLATLLLQFQVPPITYKDIWSPNGGLRLISETGETKYPEAVEGQYKYYDGSTEIVPIVLATDKTSFLQYIPSNYDYMGTDAFSELKIWSSDLATATTLGVNDVGQYPTLKTKTRGGAYVGEDTLNFQSGVQFHRRMARKIGISITGSTHYQRFGDRDLDPGLFDSLSDQYNTNIPFGGHHKIVIRGEDILGNPQEEEVSIRDDGYYCTQKEFVSVKELPFNNGRNKPAIEYDGFNGKVELQVTDIRFPSKIYPFLPAVSPESSNSMDAFGVPLQENPYVQVELARSQQGSSFGDISPLLFEISHPEGDTVGSYLDSYYLLFVNGQNYRRYGIADDIKDDYRELIASQWLLDKDREPYNAIDFAFNTFDTKIYVLDSIGRIHIYTPRLTPFEAWTFPRTLSMDIEVLPLSHRVMVGESIPLWSWHRILRSPIKSVTIMRESPLATRASQNATGVNEPAFRGDYLQADLTWKPVWLGVDAFGDDIWDDTAKYSFSGLSTDLPEVSWKDKKFWSSFPIPEGDDNPFDTLGQWNFYCETVLSGEKDRELTSLEALRQAGGINEDSYWKIKEEILRKDDTDGEFHRSCTGVMCEYHSAEATLGTEESPLVEKPYGIYFDGVSNDLCIVEEPTVEGVYNVKIFKLLSHIYLPWQAGRVPPTLVLREDYDWVGFWTPFSPTKITVNKE